MLDELRHATIEDLPEIIKIYNEAIKDGISTADSKIVSVEEKRDWFDAHTKSVRYLSKSTTDVLSHGLVFSLFIRIC